MKRKLLALGLAFCLAFGMVGCAGNEESAKNASAENATGTETSAKAGENVKIGVAIYSAEDDEVLMFRDYYEKYLGSSFDVDFVYSQPISDYQDEVEFVDSAKAEGCGGIISFITYDLSEIVNYCAEKDMYYMMGSGTQSEEAFNQVKDMVNFLGIIGPSVDNEAEAGTKMMEAFTKKEAAKKTYLILSGGSPYENFMHKERFLAMLAVLKEKGFTFEKTEEKLAATEDSLLAGTSAEGGKVYICPGYLTLEQNSGKLEAILKEIGTVDVVASTYYAAPFLDAITEQENTQSKNIQVGAVDCFCDTNRQAFQEKDAYGNSKLDFIGGKCAAMAAPAFVAMYNAITGHADVVRADGEAFWLHQNFWYAEDAEEYNTLSEQAENVYKNVYGTKDIMKVLAVYTDGALFADYEKFVEQI